MIRPVDDEVNSRGTGFWLLLSVVVMKLACALAALNFLNSIEWLSMLRLDVARLNR